MFLYCFFCKQQELPIAVILEWGKGDRLYVKCLGCDHLHKRCESWGDRPVCWSFEGNRPISVLILSFLGYMNYDVDMKLSGIHQKQPLTSKNTVLALQKLKQSLTTHWHSSLKMKHIP
jgi:hypothetical protein